MSYVRKKRRMSSNEKVLKGVLCNVGTDFVDILLTDNTVMTILRSQIKKINWCDSECSPCPVCQHSDCICEYHHDCQDDVHHDEDCSSHREHDCPRNSHHHCTCMDYLHHQPIRNHGIPLCDDRVQLRLAGLTANFNFQLFRFKGCLVEIELLDKMGNGK
ncbi:hypothetical protein P9E05_10275 [Bacillus mojavensis]|uniref:hypothetical protein n=1 Tax=Bacillus mojavensis TaxID=72360 RepID=UPI002DBDD3FC|nr:hypothetical protein [Bacillus mojavensis]MEC1613426.1 hypothetical protein [Bacillus mojavensis]MEC1621153.1 hypothetical protein [Bacillus mojavensis]MEC1660975.1 hypothetical protein [Bacillus mojavensis]MEC1691879.1 hypothetical protein [Bacillus mojavensis]